MRKRSSGYSVGTVVSEYSQYKNDGCRVSCEKDRIHSEVKKYYFPLNYTKYSENKLYPR